MKKDLESKATLAPFAYSERFIFSSISIYLEIYKDLLNGIEIMLGQFGKLLQFKYNSLRRLSKCEEDFV